MGIITQVAIGLRLYSRKMTGAVYSTDDYFIIAAGGLIGITMLLGTAGELLPSVPIVIIR